MKVLFSAKLDHDIIEGIVERLKLTKEIDFIFHDPRNDFFALTDIPRLLRDINFLIVKIGSDFSIDLLHLANIYNIPVLHDLKTVLTCKNKIALDCTLRTIFDKHAKRLKMFSLPASWNHNVSNISRFKEWALDKLPIVLKSHYQHDKFNRFNFLINEINEVDLFCKIYAQFTYYDIYIQEFIECDGIDRKIYVIGDEVYGIQRENPIHIFLRDKPNEIDVDLISRDHFKVSKEIQILASILSEELNLKIFGFDLIKSTKNNKFFLIDLNDFPGFRGIDNIEDDLANYLLKLILKK